MAIIITRNERTANTEHNELELYVRLTYTCRIDGRYVAVEPVYFASRQAYKGGQAPLAVMPVGASTEFFDATPTLAEINERFAAKFAGLSYDVEIADI